MLHETEQKLSDTLTQATTPTDRASAAGRFLEADEVTGDEVVFRRGTGEEMRLRFPTSDRMEGRILPGGHILSLHRPEGMRHLRYPEWILDVTRAFRTGAPAGSIEGMTIM